MSATWETPTRSGPLIEKARDLSHATCVHFLQIFYSLRRFGCFSLLIGSGRFSDGSFCLV